MTDSEQSVGERIVVRDDGTDRIDVTGPAIVVTRGNHEYEVVTGITLSFPAESDVWIKAWPREERRS